MSVSLSCKTCNYNSMPAYNAATGRYPIKYLSTHFYSKGVREPQASMYRVEKKIPNLLQFERVTWCDKCG